MTRTRLDRQTPTAAPLERTSTPKSHRPDASVAGHAPQPRDHAEIARRALLKIGLDMSQRPPTPPSAPTTQRVRMQHPPMVGRTFAAIDLGSSSGKLLVQRIGGDGRLHTIVDEKIGCALGKDVRNGEAIAEENQARALSALGVFAQRAQQHGVALADVAVITTAVVRNASNGAAFVRRMHDLGLTRARVLSGDEEANAGYRGALSTLVANAGADARFATVDLGGGSFQLAVGTATSMTKGASQQVGSNYVLDVLVAPHANAVGACDPAMFASIDATLAQLAPMPLPAAELQHRTLVVMGGVSQFLRAHLGHNVVSQRLIDELRREVCVMPAADRVAWVQRGKDKGTQLALGVQTEQGAMDYGRKLPASLSLLLHILRGIGVDEVTMSTTDARHGLIVQDVAARASASSG